MDKKEVILDFLRKPRDEQLAFLLDTNIEYVKVGIRKDSNHRREQKRRSAIKRRNDPRHQDLEWTLSQFEIDTANGKVSMGERRPVVDKAGYLNIVLLGKTYGVQRLVMMKHLGRFLTSEEQIHHINMRHDDNRISNLKVVTPEANLKHWKYVRTGQFGKAEKLDLHIS